MGVGYSLAPDRRFFCCGLRQRTAVGYQGASRDKTHKQKDTRRGLENLEDRVKDDCKNEPSELFEGCVNTSASLRVTCELCGREHFGHGGDYDEGELESLLEKQKSDPDKYREHDDFVQYGYIQGKQAVIGCPCNGLYRFEKWILNHKYMIMEFLSGYAKEQFEEADNLHKMAFDTQQLMQAMRTKESKSNGKIRKFDLE